MATKYCVMTSPVSVFGQAGCLVVPMRKTIDECNAANVSIYSFINPRRSSDAGDGHDYYNRPRDAAEDHGGSTDFIAISPSVPAASTLLRERTTWPLTWAASRRGKMTIT
jgi:hypothetical protein